MANKELVIKIPEEAYNNVIEGGWIYSEYIYNIIDSVKNGTPLPEGHGDLVDRAAINDRFYGIWRELNSYSNKPSQKELLDKWSMCMDDATPIIKADEEG